MVFSYFFFLGDLTLHACSSLFKAKFCSCVTYNKIMQSRSLCKMYERHWSFSQHITLALIITRSCSANVFLVVLLYLAYFDRISYGVIVHVGKNVTNFDAYIATRIIRKCHYSTNWSMIIYAGSWLTAPQSDQKVLIFLLNLDWMLW